MGNPISFIRKRWGLDAHERAFLHATAHRLPLASSSGTSPRHVLVQMPNDYFYVALFHAVLNHLAPTRVSGLWHQNVMSSPRTERWQGLRRVIRRIMNHLDRCKWQRMYRGVGTRTFFSLEVAPWQAFRHFRQADAIWRNLRTREDVLAISLDGTACGDLIYDTYLRYRVQPTVDVQDPFLRTVITQALNAQHAFRRHLARERFDCLLSSYSSYIQHGIPVREARRAGLQVLTSGNVAQFVKILRNDDVLHAAAHWEYGARYAALGDHETKRRLSLEQLERRFSGGVDKATWYMKSSAYQESELRLPEGVEGVVFLHDFFDSPHCYRSMLFPDFLAWVTATLDVISAHRLPIAIKPHPNQLPESREVVERLKLAYPDVIWLDPKLSNKTIFASGIHCGISVYGTILHELAFHGIVALAAGDHPHVDFDIAITPATAQAYRDCLAGYKALRLPEGARDAVLDFYYMHNIENKEDLPIDYARLDMRSISHHESAALTSYLARLEGDAHVRA